MDLRVVLMDTCCLPVESDGFQALEDQLLALAVVACGSLHGVVEVAET